MKIKLKKIKPLAKKSWAIWQKIRTKYQKIRNKSLRYVWKKSAPFVNKQCKTFYRISKNKLYSFVKKQWKKK
ncbi:MAG: hypothetical protein IJ566_02385 [Cardiobacteriaceae bacterium]|nr:hypothetical protein [Cardiobacteriaceae bacterium]